jgi:hypothetical protein
MKILLDEWIEDLLPLVNTILQALETIQPGQTAAIPFPD